MYYCISVLLCLYVEDSTLVWQAVNLLQQAFDIHCARDVTARRTNKCCTPPLLCSYLFFGGGSRRRAGGGHNLSHRFRLLAEEPPLHRLYEGKHDSADKAGSSGHGVHLEPHRVVPPTAAEMKHAHSFLTLQEVRTNTMTHISQTNMYIRMNMYIHTGA